jgi:hypothetical protein
VVSRPGGNMRQMNGDKWRVLCVLASEEEEDPALLIDLITRINQAFEESHQKSHILLDASACFDRVPLVSLPVEYDC